MRLDVGQTHTSCSVDAFSTYMYVGLPFSQLCDPLIIHVCVCEGMWSTVCTEENLL